MQNIIMQDAIGFVKDEISKLDASIAKKEAEREEFLKKIDFELGNLKNQKEEAKNVLEIHNDASHAIDYTVMNNSVLDVLNNSNPDMVPKGDKEVYVSRVEAGNAQLSDCENRYAQYPKDKYMIERVLVEIGSVKKNSKVESDLITNEPLYEGINFDTLDESKEKEESLNIIPDNDIKDDFVNPLDDYVSSFDFNTPLDNNQSNSLIDFNSIIEDLKSSSEKKEDNGLKTHRGQKVISIEEVPSLENSYARSLAA